MKIYKDSKGKTLGYGDAVYRDIGTTEIHKEVLTKTKEKAFLKDKEQKRLARQLWEKKVLLAWLEELGEPTVEINKEISKIKSDYTSL